jgi:sigma-54 dependent transcriptional regulator, acetoin dehydrogenase operon transcriptional activator AcoR
VNTESVLEESGGPGRGLPYWFLLLESARPSSGSARWSLSEIDDLRVGRGTARAAERRMTGGVRELLLSAADTTMSSAHVRVSRLGGRWVLQEAGSKNGTRVNGIPVERRVLASGDVVETGGVFWAYFEDPVAAGDADGADTRAGLASLIPSLARDLERLDAVACSSVPVLVRGATGTGKELVARAVHDASGRSGRFVAVNCGALPETLVESELFGHRRGAFSRATEDRPGWVKSADRGTLLLDEVGDLPLASQAALLRVLQEREVVAVGTTRPVRVDVRVIAATHRDLEAMAAEGEARFRSDLLARLRGFTIELPPLAARRAELGALFAALLRRHAPDRNIELTPAAARALVLHSFPLNVRELEQALAAALALARAGRIELEHLPPGLHPGAVSRANPAAAELSEADRELKQTIADLLAEHAGNLSAVARVLGKDRKQVRRWIQRFGLQELQR